MLPIYDTYAQTSVLLGAPDAHVEGELLIEAEDANDTTSDGNSNGVSIKYLDYVDVSTPANVTFSVNESLAEWVWMHSTDTTYKTQMNLTDENILTLYDTTGNPSIVLDPVTETIQINNNAVLLETVSGLYLDNGNVGVGASTPLENLHVGGNARVDGELFVDDQLTFLDSNSSGNATIHVGADRMIQFLDTNVAIGKNYDLSANLTGTANVLLGEYAGRELTSGSANIAVGPYSFLHNQTGTHNVSIGPSTMEYSQSGAYNVAIGHIALRYRDDADFVVAIGQGSMSNSGNDPNPLNIDFSVGVGRNTLKELNSGLANTAVGASAGAELVTGQRNTLIGHSAGGSMHTAKHNTMLGEFSAQNMDSGDYNVFVGSRAGLSFNSGNYNIAIGSYAELPSANGNYQLNIGNAIYGNLTTTEIGIGVPTPEATLHVGGDAQIDGGLDIDGPITMSAPAGDISMGIFGEES